MPANPCLTCGACCAYFRASFYWAEGDDATPGGVPAQMTDKLTPFRRVMKGTNQPNPRCIALEGEVGVRVACSIYPRRSSVCRDVMPSLWDGESRSEQCDKARKAHGMALLTLEDWLEDAPDSGFASGASSG